MNAVNKNKNKNINKQVADSSELKNKAANKRRAKRGFFGFFAHLADLISRGLQNSFLGFIFADLYVKLNEKWKKGAIYQLFHRTKRKARSRAWLAHFYEHSLIYKALSWISEKIIHSYVRVFGIGIFSFALSALLMTMLRYYLHGTEIMVDGIIGIILAVLSIPLLASKKRVGEALLTGKISGFVITQMLGLDESKLEKDESKSGGSFIASFEIAMAMGFVTYFDFLGIGTVVIIIALVLAIAMVMSFPELGIISVISIIPFVNVLEHPNIVILPIIILTSISYISKYVRGKRIMRFELIDVFVLFFGVNVIACGINTRGGVDSLYSALATFVFLCIYFLIVNSYIRKTWIFRGIKIISITAFIVSVLAIIDGGAEALHSIDPDVFSTISTRLDGVLGNANVLGTYLVIVFPFVLAQMASAERRINKFLYFICIACIIACIVLTWSRGAWLGAIVAFLVFLLVFNFRSIWLILVGGASVTALLYALVQTFAGKWEFLQTLVDRFISTFTMSDSSIQHRIKIWDKTLRMIGDNILTGIGVGGSAFKEVFPQYAIAGTETVEHTHSLYLEIFSQLGIFGIIFFAVIAFMFVQKCFVGIKNRSRGERSRNMIAAGLASVSASLVMGVTDYIWYNSRVFLIFWIMVGLTVALTKINEREKSKIQEAHRVDNNSRSADLDIFC